MHTDKRALRTEDTDHVGVENREQLGLPYVEQRDGEDQWKPEPRRQRARWIRLLSLLQIAFVVIGERFDFDMNRCGRVLENGARRLGPIMNGPGEGNGHERLSTACDALGCAVAVDN